MICRLLKESLSYVGDSLYLTVFFLSVDIWLFFVSEWIRLRVILCWKGNKIAQELLQRAFVGYLLSKVID